MTDERQYRSGDAETVSGREALAHAVDEVSAWLRDRQVTLHGEESSEELVSLREAVERFEQAVEARGGDLFIDSGDASEPDDPAFVLPRRGDDESVNAFIARVDRARTEVLGRPPVA